MAIQSHNTQSELIRCQCKIIDCGGDNCLKREVIDILLDFPNCKSLFSFSMALCNSLLLFRKHSASSDHIDNLWVLFYSFVALWKGLQSKEVQGRDSRDFAFQQSSLLADLYRIQQQPHSNKRSQLGSFPSPQLELKIRQIWPEPTKISQPLFLANEVLRAQSGGCPWLY